MVNLMNNAITQNVPSAWYSTLENFIVKGKNAEIWDSEGKRYLDYVGGYAVLNTGHLHPRVVEKVKNQLNDFSHSCFAFAPHENAVKLSEELNKRYPITSDTKTFMVNSGAEAVENAVKIARYYTNKKSIISFKGGFHGRTYLAMGLTGKDKPYKEGFGPFPEFVKHALYPYLYRDISDDDALASIKDLFKKTLNPDDTAAVVVEIQLGEGGYIPASNYFLKSLREICDYHNILLIFDEVQTGYGRTGEMFGAETVGVNPDLVTLAKGIAGGFPLAAVLGKAEIMDTIHDAGIGSTFGASPVSCAAALGVLEAFDNENILGNASKQSEMMNSFLKNLMNENEFIGDVRGYGPMIGVEIVENKDSKTPNKEKAQEIINNCRDNGLLLVTCGENGNVIRFMGPLTTPIKHVEEALGIFENSII
ncbi:aspartate aminotransferase family protein [Acidimicrobiaceae bacterium]|nr:aspartate aminotransferase family protein [Acidimicrobiaceae bacterium]